MRLGSTTWEVVSKVVLPYTKAGRGRHHAGLGPRTGGDHGGDVRHWQLQPAGFVVLFQAANSITSALANEFAEAASGLHQAALIYLGLVLFFITFVVLALSKLLLAQLRKNEGAKS
jgi:phosphate transport system permease protein